MVDLFFPLEETTSRVEVNEWEFQFCDHLDPGGDWLREGREGAGTLTEFGVEVTCNLRTWTGIDKHTNKLISVWLLSATY